ncbi:transposase family protein, partial [Streptomyces flaveolus]
MAGVLRAERVWVETFTRLRTDQFGRLLKAVRERGGEGCGWGRPWRLPLAERVLLVAVYYRTNLTMRQLAPLFGISPATVCRVIQRLGPLLALEPARACADATDRLWIVDGTLVPVRDRKVGASSRNYRFSANMQVIVDAETRLVVATARPVPGNTAEAKAWRDSGLAQHCEGGRSSATALLTVRVPSWSRGRVVLLGDAAAATALYALAEELAAHPGDHARAFAAYESRLRREVGPRQRRVGLLSRL